MKKRKNTVDFQIINRIYGHGKDWVFTPDHFKDIGSRNAIASALKRYKQKGTIRQLARGLYDYPRIDPELGVIQPSMEALAKALEGRDATRMQPTGAYAANLLGLTTQVPTKIAFLTDGSPPHSAGRKPPDYPQADHTSQHGNCRQNQWSCHSGPASLRSTKHQ